MSFFESIFYMAWRGIAIGLIISAPMGPVGMLCIQRTLDKGRRAGFYTGIGAALSDLFYSLLTGFGLSFIEEFLERNQNIIQLVGSGVLIAFGIYLFRKNPAKQLRKPVEQEISIKKNILGGFLFTFSNPLILFLIIGLFARFNFLLPEFKLYQYFTGFVFIFVGAIIWWWFITFSIDKVRHHFNIRSMWLINRIIGVIILLFAVVGIFTATSELVKGAETQCWNGKRGYGPFAVETTGENTEVNRLLNMTADTLTFLAPCGGSDVVEFRCKVKNHRASTTKKYDACGADGHKRKVSAPPWGMVILGDDGSRIFIDISQTETESDGISSQAALRVGVRYGDGAVAQTDFAEKSNLFKKIKGSVSGPDPTGSLNFFKISLYDDLLTLSGGSHTPAVLFSERLPRAIKADSIGFYLAPGAEISPDELRLTTGDFSPVEPAWADCDLLEEYLENSSDRMEGYWQVLDRSLDEALIKLGGDYRFAMVRSLDGYDLIYLSGARVNADRWLPGMVKARFSPSGIGNLWNVDWTDVMFQHLNHEIKAQTDASGTLTIQFPYQNSQLRLFHSNTR